MIIPLLSFHEIRLACKFSKYHMAKGTGGNVGGKNY